MTEAMLVTLISLMCDQANFNIDKRIDCYERLVNCSVVNDGKILTIEEFKDKCKLKVYKE